MEKIEFGDWILYPPNRDHNETLHRVHFQGKLIGMAIKRKIYRFDPLFKMTMMVSNIPRSERDQLNMKFDIAVQTFDSNK